MRYDQLDEEIKKLLIDNEISWNSSKNIYMTILHKDFYLNEREVKSNENLKEFCKLIRFLKSNLEYGVSTDWERSNLNRYVYFNNKSELKEKFPNTIEALARFYDDSDIMNFYKLQGAKTPTVIDLIGTTGAGKTTFCQQFVDKNSKELLKCTITDSAESTVIQTDILILERTNKKMFLKVRNRNEIMKDIMSVALEIDVTRKSSTIKDSILKKSDIAKNEALEKVSNFYITEDLLNSFKEFSVKVQEKFKTSDITDKFTWVNNASSEEEFLYILEDNIKEIIKDTYFYGYRLEYDLENDAEIKVVTTIANTVFKNRKEELEDYPEMENKISYRILFDHAILVLPVSEEAKNNLEYDFKQGIVFRDSQGHILDEQNGIASDFEVENKIFLIPVDNGGYLIDERYSNLFEKILISEPKNNIFVLTKVDNTTTYKKYKKGNYEDSKRFNKDFKEKIAKTHNKLLENFLQRQKGISGEADIYIDETTLFGNFISSFNNAYLSEIDDTTYSAEAHKINYSGSTLEMLEKEKLEIEYCENSWFEIVSNIIEGKNLSYNSNLYRNKDIDELQCKEVINYCTDMMKNIIEFFISNQDWQSIIDEQLEVFNKDFRAIYQKGEVWFYSNYITDGNTTNTNSYFKDMTAKTVRDINSYVIRDNSKNYITKLIQLPLSNYLGNLYSSKNGNDFEILNVISNKIIMNSLEKAIKISYKVFDRNLTKHNSIGNLGPIFIENSKQYVRPSNITLDDIKEYTRTYGTYTEYYAGIYCNLVAKYKYNLEKYFVEIFKTVLEYELKELNDKVK